MSNANVGDIGGTKFPSWSGGMTRSYGNFHPTSMGEIHRIRISRYRGRYRMRPPISFQSKVSPQNGGFIYTELAPTLFVGKAKPFFMEIDKNLSSHSERNLLNNFLLYWIITGNLPDYSFEQYR